jgi:Rieske Fe-S protein
MQNRRAFIKQSCGLCLGVVGLGVLATQLTSCAPLPLYKSDGDKNNITVPFTAFTEKSNMVIVRNPNQEFDILLIKRADGSYYAMQMKCTHQDNPLTVNQSGLFCSAHGSTFDLDGKVTKEPALRPLQTFKTEINNSSVLIHIVS